MLLLTTFALFAASAVQAAQYNVSVAESGLTFTPNSVTAASGDTVLFTFKAGSHTVTQSTFADPCKPLANGVDSGTKPAQGVTPAPTFTYNVNGTAPAWFYCKTGSHCQGGMVFAVNPSADKTFDAFKAKAQGGTASSGASGSATPTSSGSSPATSSGAATPRAPVGVGAVAAAAAAFLFGTI